MTAILRYARSTTQFAIFKVPFWSPVCMCCKIVVCLHVKGKEIQFGANFFIWKNNILQLFRSILPKSEQNWDSELSRQPHRRLLVLDIVENIAWSGYRMELPTINVLDHNSNK